MTACTCAPVYGWRNRLVGYAQDHACTLHGQKKVEIMIPINCQMGEAIDALDDLPEDERAEVIAAVVRRLKCSRGKIIEAAREAMGGRGPLIGSVLACDVADAWAGSAWCTPEGRANRRPGDTLAVALDRLEDATRGSDLRKVP